MKTEFYESLIDIMLCLSISDGTILEKELEIIKRTIKAFDIDYKLPKKIEDFPSLNNALDKIETDEEIMILLDYIIHIAAVDGQFHQNEKEIISNILNELGLNGIEGKIFSVIQKRVEVEKEWKDLRNGNLSYHIRNMVKKGDYKIVKV